ncbi:MULTISPECIES: DUF1656 domain-containing protein [unclassified Methylobacterium]|uniref:DUF1656 domain-containing protein n=1 Tax=unclassified Methylobacterium TaxID=2615210 RepID=UPI0011CABA82|nr:DUF1656 domain-containing protein [Methylobacterium sp. WL64]TXN02049.1 DUF1656 domain-containing protein [Methylobacterium sp. WL64]
MPLREIDILGVFVAPFAPCVLIAGCVTGGVVIAVRRIRATRRWSHAPLIELVCFTVTLSGLVLMLGRL